MEDVEHLVVIPFLVQVLKVVGTYHARASGFAEYQKHRLHSEKWLQDSAMIQGFRYQIFKLDCFYRAPALAASKSLCRGCIVNASR